MNGIERPDVKSEYYIDPNTGDRYVKVKPGGTTNSKGDDAGSVVVDGLANNAVRVSATTYNTTVMLGFRVLLKGTGTLTFTPNTVGATPIIVTAAELTAMGVTAFNDWPIACSTITAGAGMELLVYIP